MAAFSGPAASRLLSGLPPGNRADLIDRCQRVDLSFGDILCEPEQPFRQVYFPLDGFISLVACLRGQHPLEMGLIGSEGMLGATLVLGVDEAPLRGVVQGAGSFLRMDADAFRAELRAAPALALRLQPYVYVLLAQLAQSAACLRFHDVDARLARWLLATHDRAHNDSFHLTHGFLAGMLGVRRSSITLAAGKLRQGGLIQYRRGDIRVLDRKGLEAVSCSCYGEVVGLYARQLGAV